MDEQKVTIMGMLQCSSCVCIHVYHVYILSLQFAQCNGKEISWKHLEDLHHRDSGAGRQGGSRPVHGSQAQVRAYPSFYLLKDQSRTHSSGMYLHTYMYMYMCIAFIHLFKQWIGSQ